MEREREREIERETLEPETIGRLRDEQSTRRCSLSLSLSLTLGDTHDGTALQSL